MTNPRPSAPVLVLATTLALAALAGCINEDPEPANRAPVAMVEADREERWTEETFTFNASRSHDPDGNITTYHFDFGDGNSYTTTDADEAEAVRHSYAEPGPYEITLTVTDDGEDGTGTGNGSGNGTGNGTGNNTGNRSADRSADNTTKEDTTTIHVVVNDRHTLAPEALLASPVSDMASRAEHPFDVNANSSHFELDLVVQSTLAAGGSSVTVRVLDPNGEVLSEDNVTVEAGEETQLNLSAELPDKGEHTVETVATSGAVLVSGELRVYYQTPMKTAA